MIRTPKNTAERKRMASLTSPDKKECVGPPKLLDTTFDFIDLATTSSKVKKSVERLEQVRSTSLPPSPSPQKPSTSSSTVNTMPSLPYFPPRPKQLTNLLSQTQTSPPREPPQPPKRPSPKIISTNPKPGPSSPVKPKPGVTSTLKPIKAQPKKVPKPQVEYVKSPNQQREKHQNRMAEATACKQKVFDCMGESRNLRTDLKTGITETVVRMHRLIELSEEELNREKQRNHRERQKETNQEERKDQQTQTTQTKQQERKTETGSESKKDRETDKQEKPDENSGYRLAEAKDCAQKIGKQLEKAKSVSYPIKNEIERLTDRLILLVAETSLRKTVLKRTPTRNKPEETTTVPEELGSETEKKIEKEKGNLTEKEYMKWKMEEHTDLLKGTMKEQMKEYRDMMRKNNENIESLKEMLREQKEILVKASYASKAAGKPTKPLEDQGALHSVVVSSTDEGETGEDVLNKIRKAVNAKDGWVTVEKIRKARDRKVILGCKTEAERKQLMGRLKATENHLTVQEVQNKNPLVILKDVLNFNSDEEVLRALKNQNKNILRDLEEKDSRMEILYKRRTRNPHTSHIVMRVSPTIWRRFVDSEAVKIDLQKVRVADQSPLVQCSRCLGYGHGRRFCTETKEKCSHCGGQHMKADCADWLAGALPACCNCTQAKMDRNEHNAFSQDCPIRKRWDTLARASVAYC